MFAQPTDKQHIIDKDGQMWELTPTKEPGVWEAKKIYAPSKYPGTEKYEASIREKLKETGGSFEDVVRPVIKWLCENVHPHHTIIITPTNAQLLEGKLSTGDVFDYVRDKDLSEGTTGGRKDEDHICPSCIHDGKCFAQKEFDTVSSCLAYEESDMEELKTCHECKIMKHGAYLCSRSQKTGNTLIPGPDCPFVLLAAKDAEIDKLRERITRQSELLDATAKSCETIATQRDKAEGQRDYFRDALIDGIDGLAGIRCPVCLFREHVPMHKNDCAFIAAKDHRRTARFDGEEGER